MRMHLVRTLSHTMYNRTRITRDTISVDARVNKSHKTYLRIGMLAEPARQNDGAAL